MREIHVAGAMRPDGLQLMAKKAKPKVWAHRHRPGVWIWFVTFPDGDAVACEEWRHAIAALDRYVRLHATGFALR